MADAPVGQKISGLPIVTTLTGDEIVPIVKDGANAAARASLIGNASITAGIITTALGYAPYSAANPSAYINSGQALTTARNALSASGPITYNNSTGAFALAPIAAGTVLGSSSGTSVPSARTVPQILGYSPASVTLGNLSTIDLLFGGTVAVLDVPLGNPYAPTYTKFSAKMYGDDPLVLAGARAFPVMGGVDNRGYAGEDNLTDLVAGYFGAIAAPYSTGDANTVRMPVWAINTVTKLSENSGTYNARGIEVDFVNDVRPIGGGDGPSYLSEVIAVGLQAYHSGLNGSTAAFLADHGSDGSAGWFRGFAVAPGAATQAGFADYSDAAYSFDSRGSHAYGLHFTGTYSNGHVLKGPLSIGKDGGGNIPDPESGVTLDVWGAAKVRTFLNVLGATNLEGTLGVKLDGTLKLVSVGAADSGGAGFKVLRVAN